MKILLFTTRENFVWTSMQEIIPGIESLWHALDSEKYNIETINVDKLKINELCQQILNADVIVLTAFNVKIALAARFARRDLLFSGRIYTYLHGMSSVGCWPFHEWELSKYLNQKDVFISSCRKDISLFRKAYENSQALLMPFHMEEDELISPTIGIENEVTQFVYIGRISEQKNIHTLILAFSLFLKRVEKEVKLVIYGEEDDLGSPNMGKISGEYLYFLKDLAKNLGIEKEVQFKGFVPRGEINHELNKKDFIFISSSLHSDENFGMAALRCLLSGRRAILSNWGGHSDFQNQFDKNVFLVDVVISDNGPVLYIDELVEKMVEAFGQRPESVNFPECYIMRSNLKILEESLKRDLFVAEIKPLEVSELGKEIWERRKNYLDKSSNFVDRHTGSRLFEGYCDELSHRFFASYAEGERVIQVNEEKEYFLVPWGEFNDNSLKIVDPHKGETHYHLEEGSHFINGIDGGSKVGDYLFNSLKKSGYLFSKGEQ
jgi:glycosyltransferase involved in cell wall biosynthesis